MAGSVPFGRLAARIAQQKANVKPPPTPMAGRQSMPTPGYGRPSGRGPIAPKGRFSAVPAGLRQQAPGRYPSY